MKNNQQKTSDRIERLEAVWSAWYCLGTIKKLRLVRAIYMYCASGLNRKDYQMTFLAS